MTQTELPFERRTNTNLNFSQLFSTSLVSTKGVDVGIIVVIIVVDVVECQQLLTIDTSNLGCTVDKGCVDKRTNLFGSYQFSALL